MKMQFFWSKLRNVIGAFENTAELYLLMKLRRNDIIKQSKVINFLKIKFLNERSENEIFRNFVECGHFLSCFRA